MTSTKNSQQLNRLRGVRSAASERFTRQLKLMSCLDKTASELERTRTLPVRLE